LICIGGRGTGEGVSSLFGFRLFRKIQFLVLFSFDVLTEGKQVICIPSNFGFTPSRKASK
jgi:hypothetical protein